MPTLPIEVRDEERNRRRTDDSPSGKAALDWAAQQARSTGAVLRAVHALDWPGRPPTRASLGIMDPVGGPHCDEADPLSPHCGPVGGAGGAWAASGAGRSGADLNAEQCEASLLPVSAQYRGWLRRYER